MTDVTENKRLSDEELEAVAGGVSPPTIDPSALAGLMHSTVSAAVAGGGAYTVDTHTPAHTDTGAPTITAPHTTATPTDPNPDVQAADAWFASHSAGTAPTPQASDAQNVALIKSIYEPTPGQAPVQSTGTSMPPPHVADPNQIIHTIDPATGKPNLVGISYNIYE